MNLITSEEQDFAFFWDKFITENRNVSWRYLPKWIEYEKSYAASCIVKDLSFILVDHNLPVSICPLFLEEHDGFNCFSYAGSYQAAPLVKFGLPLKHGKRIERACFEKIDKLAVEHDVKRTMFILDSLTGIYDYNLLTEYGYIDSSINTSMIGLSSDIKSLWSNLRKSYKSLINNGRDKFSISIIDHNNPDFEVHEAYRKLHHKTAGRVTRPKETFDIQFEMLKDDNAILVGLQEDKRHIGFSYFLHNNKGAYYASASDDPEYDSDVPLEHSIIWAAIDYYVKRNFEFLEMGSQQFGSQLFDHPGEKDISISFFKRGFGGRTVALYRGMKYYDMDVFRRDLEINVNKLLAQ